MVSRKNADVGGKIEEDARHLPELGYDGTLPMSYNDRGMALMLAPTAGRQAGSLWKHGGRKGWTGWRDGFLVRSFVSLLWFWHPAFAALRVAWSGRIILLVLLISGLRAEFWALSTCVFMIAFELHEATLLPLSLRVTRSQRSNGERYAVDDVQCGVLSR